MQLHPQHHLNAVALYLQLVSSLISVVFAANINTGKHNKQATAGTDTVHFIGV
jgi:hypothetical protein